MSDSETIAFIGLGNMGGPMAVNLRKRGHSVRGFDLSAAARDTAAGLGLTISSSATDAVAGVHTVITMLPASRHVESLYLGDGGLLTRLAKGTLVIDSSTIAPASSHKVAEAAQARGLAFIDAPVSGGTIGAAAGTLTFMIGGAAADVERATPLLKNMGANLFHAGAHGAGQATKLCNNMLLAVLMIGTFEALSLGASLRLDPKVLSEVMRRSWGGQLGAREVQPGARRDGRRAGVAWLQRGLRHGSDAEGSGARVGSRAGERQRGAAGRPGARALRCAQQGRARGARFLQHHSADVFLNRRVCCARSWELRR